MSRPALLPVPWYHRHAWWYAALAAAAAAVVWPQAARVRPAFGLVAAADGRWLLLAALWPLGSHLVAAEKYRLLAWRRLRLWPTLLVQLVALLTSRIVPAGLGGAGANYLYLRRQRHSGAQAAAVVGLNDALGLMGHGLLVAGLLLTGSAGWQQLHPHVSWQPLDWLLLAASGLVVSWLVRRYWSHLRRGLASFWRTLRAFRGRPGRLAGALAASLLITLGYALSLWCSALALHAPLAFGPALMVLTIGIAAGTVTPTPGGLVGAEAGLAAGLLAYRLSLDQAVAITLLYRLVSFWLSLLLGAMVLPLAERRRLLS